MTDDHPGLSDRQFGLTFAGIFSGIGALRWFAAGAFPQWTLLLAGLFSLLAVTAPSGLMPFNRIWGRVTRRIAIINSHLVLGLIFYGVISPIGFLLRLFGHDSMSLSGGSVRDTYLTPVRRDADPDSFRDQF